MREQLIAYIEGTLSAEARRDVLYHLQHSRRWQREWDKVKRVQSCLANSASWHEFAEAPKLESLLPTILDRAKGPTPRYHYWWKGLQLMLVLTCLFGTLLLIPLLLGDSTASAQNGWSPNNPVNTSTSTNTPEGMAIPRFAALEKTQEPKLNTMRVIVIEFAFGSAYYHQATATIAHCEASASGNTAYQAAAVNR